MASVSGFSSATNVRAAMFDTSAILADPLADLLLSTKALRLEVGALSSSLDSGGLGAEVERAMSKVLPSMLETTAQQAEDRLVRTLEVRLESGIANLLTPIIEGLSARRATPPLGSQQASPVSPSVLATRGGHLLATGVADLERGIDDIGTQLQQLRWSLQVSEQRQRADLQETEVAVKRAVELQNVQLASRLLQELSDTMHVHVTNQTEEFTRQLYEWSGLVRATLLSNEVVTRAGHEQRQRLGLLVREEVRAALRDEHPFLSSAGKDPRVDVSVHKPVNTNAVDVIGNEPMRPREDQSFGTLQEGSRLKDDRTHEQRWEKLHDNLQDMDAQVGKIAGKDFAFPAKGASDVLDQGERQSQSGLSLRVVVVGARGLPLNRDAYCAYEVPGKADSCIQTPIVVNATDPTWNHEGEVSNFGPTDSLEFRVCDQASPSTNGLIGSAVVLASRVLPTAGFDGELLLLPGIDGLHAALRVRIEVLNLGRDATAADSSHAASRIIF